MWQTQLSGWLLTEPSRSDCSVPLAFYLGFEKQLILSSDAPFRGLAGANDRPPQLRESRLTRSRGAASPCHPASRSNHFCLTGEYTNRPGYNSPAGWCQAEGLPAPRRRATPGSGRSRSNSRLHVRQGPQKWTKGTRASSPASKPGNRGRTRLAGPRGGAGSEGGGHRASGAHQPLRPQVTLPSP